MRISTAEAEVPVVESVTVTEDTLTVDLSDGRTISVPYSLSPLAAPTFPLLTPLMRPAPFIG